MYLYTYDDINKEITSYGIADGMTKTEMKEAKRNGFLFTDRNIIDDFQGHLYFEDELSEEKLNEINIDINNTEDDSDEIDINIEKPMYRKEKNVISAKESSMRKLLKKLSNNKNADLGE